MPNELYPNTEFVADNELTASIMSNFNDRIKGGFDLLARVIVDMVGDDCVIDDPDSETELKVTATSPASMNVNVNIGIASISDTICQNESQATFHISSPTANNRYTIIQISNRGVISTQNSAEAANPVEPDAKTDNIKLAAIYLPQSTAIIEDTDNGNGYIIDRRAMSNSLPQTSVMSLTIPIYGSLMTISGPNGDGYVFGSSSSGMKFNFATEVKYCSIQCQEKTIGASTIVTIRNITDATSQTVTISDGFFSSFNNSIDLDFDINDELAIQITQQGSSQPAGWGMLMLGYRGQ